ncbi:MAG: NAD(P)/FAD-dependent oxidoreductase [Candidatus Kapabacteria bacterium]|nr:NAD(P)/FAD-dependent oxidoreductase [Candidatus Kapabacteria bacterium]
MDYDVLIVGAGVVGLSCSAILSSAGLSVLCVERHTSFGSETSSRNSEVIHAGIYYPQNSLKALLCVAGNRSLYDWCNKYQVPHRRLGKYIVASTEDELSKLESIYSNSQKNDVPDISRITQSEINRMEPNVRAMEALFSASTGIIDSHKLMESFEYVARENGCDFAYNHKLVSIEKLNVCFKSTLILPDNNKFDVKTNFIINSAGLESDNIAAMAGIDIEKENYRLHFCRGHYFRIKSSKKHLATHLIYPIPPSHGLGIHLTIDMNSELKLGPDTDFLENNIYNYTVSEELKDKFYSAASLYLKGLEREDIYPDQAGIRPKLRATGDEFRDFIIQDESDKGLPKLINLIGIESPGLTCSIEIGKMVKNMVMG